MVATTAHTFLDISNGGWSAIASCGGLLLAIAAAIFGYRQFSEARRTREEQAQPYVAIYMEPTEADPHAVDLIIKNFGATAAKDVHVTIDPPPEQLAGGEITDVKVPSLIRTLVPGQEWTTFWDTAIARNNAEDVPKRHTATISFTDLRGRKLGPYTFDLDWDAIIERGWIVTYGMHELARAVRDIRDLLKNRGDLSNHHVMSFDGDAHNEQERERWEQVVKEREREQQEQDIPEESSD
jgi:hypothetical protein